MRWGNGLNPGRTRFAVPFTRNAHPRPRQHPLRPSQRSRGPLPPPSTSYTRAPTREKRQLLERYAYLAFQLDADVSIHRVCRLDGDSWSVEAYAVISLGAPQLNGALQRAWASLDLSARRIESLAGVDDPRNRPRRSCGRR